MIYVEVFLAFFVPNIIGYGGGPATIPLIEHEVVNNYGWMTKAEFSEVLAIGNTLPGPIATKMAAYVGYEVAGIAGAAIAIIATVGPAVFLMLVLLKILHTYRHSTRIKRLSSFVLPAITVLMGALTVDFFVESWHTIGTVATISIAVVSLILLEKFKIHPAFVIVGGLAVGALLL